MVLRAPQLPASLHSASSLRLVSIIVSRRCDCLLSCLTPVLVTIKILFATSGPNCCFDSRRALPRRCRNMQSCSQQRELVISPKELPELRALAATGATPLQHHHLTRPPTPFVSTCLVSTANEPEDPEGEQTGRKLWCARWDAVGATRPPSPSAAFHPLHGDRYPRPYSSRRLPQGLVSINPHLATHSSCSRPPCPNRCHDARTRRGTSRQLGPDTTRLGEAR